MSHHGRMRTFKHLKTVGGTHVWQLKGAPDRAAFFFECGLTVDADGSPKAYAPPGTVAQDYLANAGQPGHWWGVVTNRQGQPIVQSGSPTQPARGFYISQTSLHDIVSNANDVRRWVDANEIPYFVMPMSYFKSTGLMLGDMALLVNANNGTYCFAVLADAKNKPNLGEVSIAAAARLGAPTSAKNGSLARGIIKLVFPANALGQGFVLDAHTIDVVGRMALEHFSTFRDKNDALLTAYPEFPRFAGALTDAGYITN